MILQSYLFKSVFAITTAAAFSSCSTNSSLANGSTITKPSVKSVSKKATSSSSKTIGKDKHGMSTYSDSSRTRHVRMTAYSHMEGEVGAPGRKNAAGTILKYGSTLRSAAADWSVLPLGTKFKVKGNPNVTYVVDDYGSALVGTNTVDMFFPSLSQMRKHGTRKKTIQIIQMGSFERSARLLKGRVGHRHCRKMYYAIKNKMSKKVAKN